MTLAKDGTGYMDEKNTQQALTRSPNCCFDGDGTLLAPCLLLLNSGCSQAHEDNASEISTPISFPGRRHASRRLGWTEMSRNRSPFSPAASNSSRRRASLSALVSSGGSRCRFRGSAKRTSASRR
nr:hypothetical protein CFP56_31608 [Quercus suber]